jgi:hypothetical protein
MTAPAPLLIALLPLLLWRMIVRLRRQVGRQRSSAMRHRIHLGLYPALAAIVAWLSAKHHGPIEYLAVGAMLGAALAQYGLGVTRFEPTRQGLFYTPKASLGISLSLLFVGRIAYRLAQVLWADPATGGAPGLWQSALTLGIFGLLAGYNTAYAVGMMLWRRRVMMAARRGRDQE